VQVWQDWEGGDNPYILLFGIGNGSAAICLILLHVNCFYQKEFVVFLRLGSC
jgi:hypothetical protein